jgi:hypothetical protein
VPKDKARPCGSCCQPCYNVAVGEREDDAPRLSRVQDSLILSKRERADDARAVDVEHGTAGDARALGLGVIFLYPCPKLLRVETLPELRLIQAKFSDERGDIVVGRNTAEVALTLVDQSPHLPKSVLRTSTLRNFSQKARPVAKLRQVTIHQPRFAGGDIFVQNPGFGFQHVESTRRSKEVRIVRHEHRCVGLAQHVIAFRGRALL